tara:strand:- start:7242 stop:7901 length:660 start_codon:yes stop_codon:yes gene_type:complete
MTKSNTTNVLTQYRDAIATANTAQSGMAELQKAREGSHFHAIAFAVDAMHNGVKSEGIHKFPLGKTARSNRKEKAVWTEKFLAAAGVKLGGGTKKTLDSAHLYLLRADTKDIRSSEGAFEWISTQVDDGKPIVSLSRIYSFLANAKGETPEEIVARITAKAGCKSEADVLKFIGTSKFQKAFAARLKVNAKIGAKKEAREAAKKVSAKKASKKASKKAA